ncbi:sporulation histidine kinase inhibitor Sda [Paenibacillus sp. LMG 31461]|uniref:Sporulation histidine kinase inhibitor Sda n=1 Tax=Paenibacillus plantarum TaxID=2654975 RepID=A0ABX1XKA7_9BACL|nr:sporulation histidine kinase inhibitor Sda [Paenibacillus plantarum]NOU68333.1 sporulation histidine kinase inhibitor Sda [Paenibacillus plantarum]
MKLSDDALLSAYKDALILNLNEEFIELLEKELINRDIAFIRPSKEEKE